jgi:hypothetical protein
MVCRNRRNTGGRIVKKYWWIFRTDDNCGLPYDTFIKWYEVYKLVYWLIKYEYSKANYWCTFTWVDMQSNIGEQSLFSLRYKSNV